MNKGGDIISTGMEIDGLDNLMDRLEKMGRAGGRLEGKALKTAGEVLADEMKNNLQSNGNVRTGKLRDGIKVSGVRKKGDKKYVVVGIQKGDNSEIFYGKFLEWGASPHQIKTKNGGVLNHPGVSAQPFLGPAYESKKKEAKDLIVEEIKKGLGL